MTRVRPLRIVWVSLALLAVLPGPGLSALPPDWPSSFWGEVDIPGYTPTASTALRIHCDTNANHRVDPGEPQAAATPLWDAGGDVGWVYTVHVPAGTCSPGEALAWELSQPPSVSHAPLAIDEDSGPAQVAVTVVEGYGRVAFPAGQDPVWQGGTNTRHDLAALALYGEVTLDITAAPAHGVAGVAGTTITYTPADDYCGPDTLSYTATALDGQSATGEVAIAVACVNDPPSALTLSHATVAEDAPPGTVVGTLGVTDPDPGDSHTYALVAGEGDGGNGAFAIEGQALRTAVALDGSQSSYAIRVRATDAQGAWVEEVFAITVLDVNHAPTGLDLTGATVAEDAPLGTAVGTLSTTDPDAGDSHTYTLVAGEGDGGNGAFAIDGETLRVAGALDHEAQPTTSVRIRTTDAAGATLEGAFPIAITDVNEAPVVTAPPGQTIAQDGAFATVDLGACVADPDAGDTHTWSAAGAEHLAVQIDGALATLTVTTPGWEGEETITFTAEDSGGLTGSAGATFEVLARQTIPLVEGWNLIGLGLEVGASAPEAVLGGIAGRYDLVYAWDPTRGAEGGWLLYDHSDPEFPADLTAVGRGQGLWVHVTEDGGPLQIDGRAEGTTVVAVEADAWHLVGLASGVAEALPGALAAPHLPGGYTLVYGYDAGDPADPWEVYDPGAEGWANDLGALEPGRGYWLRTGVGQAGTWTVTYERPTP